METSSFPMLNVSSSPHCSVHSERRGLRQKFEEKRRILKNNSGRVREQIGGEGFISVRRVAASAAALLVFGIALGRGS